jgi:hypothetical protein
MILLLMGAIHGAMIGLQTGLTLIFLITYGPFTAGSEEVQHGE